MSPAMQFSIRYADPGGNPEALSGATVYDEDGNSCGRVSTVDYFEGDIQLTIEIDEVVLDGGGW
jgi:hypothetical protein